MEMGVLFLVGYTVNKREHNFGLHFLEGHEVLFFFLPHGGEGPASCSEDEQGAPDCQ